MKKNEIVVHHNYLNESKFVDFTELEMNLFITILYKMRQEKKDIEIVFQSDDIKRMVNSKDRSYKEFERIIHSLQDRTFYLKTLEGYERIKPFPTLIFNDEKKTVTIDVNKRMFPIFKELKEQFTQYSLKEFVSLENKYGKRMFQLLKQYETIGKRTFELENLKEILDCNNKSYDKMSNLDKKVLKRAKDDINSKTSLNIDYKKIKNGRKVESIEFTILKNQKDTLSDNNQIKLFDSNKIGKKTVTKRKTTKKTLKNNPKIKEVLFYKDTLSDKLGLKVEEIKNNIFINKGWNKRIENKIIKLYKEEGEEYTLNILNNLNKDINTNLKGTLVQYINTLMKKIKVENHESIKEINEMIKITDKKLNLTDELTLEEFNNLNPDVKKDIERKAINLTCKEGNMTKEFLLNVKKKSEKIYFNIIKSNVIIKYNNREGGNR